MYEMCFYCCCFLCVFFSEILLVCLRVFGLFRMINYMKWKGDYRFFYIILNCCGLWCDFIYIVWKEVLGCYVEDVWEVMLICVVEDVRKWWLNFDGVFYCGYCCL